MKRILWLALGLALLLAGPAVGPLAAAEAWQPIGPFGGTATDLVLHPRNPRILWAVTYGTGLFQSVDGGASWKVVEGLGFPYVVSLAVAPSDPDILYAAAVVLPFPTSRVGLLRSTDGGRSWSVMLDCSLQPPPCCGCVALSWASRLIVDPRDPRTVFAATSRGLFRSVDGGASWRKAGLTHNVQTLAFDPRNPEIVYAGGGGVSRSTDGGLSWRLWGEGIGAGQFIYAIAIDPANPRRIWAGGPDGVYRSTDGGAHWRPHAAGLRDRPVWDLALSPVAGGGRPALWAATSRGIVRSLDGGATWVLAGAEWQGRSVRSLVAHPGRPGTLWAATGWPLTTGAGIYKTVDAGATWRFSSRGFHAIPMGALAFDPATPGILWTGSTGFGVHRGTGGGAAWSWTQRNGTPPHEVPSQVDGLAVDPRAPEAVWAAGVYGVHVTDDAGLAWEDRSEGLLVAGYEVTVPTQVIRLAPSDPSIAYTGTIVGLYKTVDAGAHWTRLESLPSLDVRDVWIDPRDPDVVFVAAGDLWISRDGGATWGTAPLGAAPAATQVLALDPRNPDVLFVGGGSGLFRSADGGRTWQQVRPAAVRAVAVGPTGEVWAVTANGILRSLDGVSGWASVPDLQGPVILEIAVDPHDPDGVFLGTSAGVFRKGG